MALSAKLRTMNLTRAHRSCGVQAWQVTVPASSAVWALTCRVDGTTCRNPCRSHHCHDWNSPYVLAAAAWERTETKPLQ